MKRTFLGALAALVSIAAMAIPAHRGNAKVAQPDGSQLTIKLVGDEYYHFNTTVDGYTIVQDASGVYQYAVRDGEQLKASGIKAHDLADRTPAENAFLAQTAKYITDRDAHAQGEAQRAKRMSAPGEPQKAPNYSNYRGLIILINLTDVKFSMPDPNAFYSEMCNTPNWTGYTNTSGQRVPCTGSLRDYYTENSNGMFTPEFDIIGPVSVNYSSTSFRGTSYAQTIFKAALTAADNMGCDFSRYDGNGDGTVDLVFFQVAGMSSSFAGNNGNWLWPHQSSFYYTNYDGKRIGYYACSTELYGWTSEPASITVEGIGTICHEFSHVLGLPDLYDTNYETSGQSHDPDMWDIMAGGGSANSSRTPCGYSIYERYSLGFAKPTVLTTPGHYTLNPIMSNEGYIIKSPVAREYFILDNRQKTRWDAYLPGHGMIVARVDSTSTSPWNNNTVNANPNHNYYELLRAGNSTSGSLASDPFPGTTGNNKLCSTSKPKLATWNGSTTEMGLFNISEVGGVISFDFRNENDVQKVVEDFEKMPATTSKTATGVQGNFATWDFNQCNVVEPGTGNCNGKRAVSMLTPSVFTSTQPVYYNCDQITFEVNNTSSTTAKVALQYSIDGGTTWVKPKSSSGSTPVSISGNTKASTSWALNLLNTQGALFRVQMSAGSKTVPIYVDDFTIYYNGEPGKPAVKGDVNGDGKVDINDVNVLINIMLGFDSASKYNGRADVNGDSLDDIADVNELLNLMLN
ncbi:MAG: M6 family metalloprotease domain-containing protein [Muribaculaceae bacterium]|nr:M6 family metalloprotease domain-containing protein [Muribaculaceae bacterium]